MKPLNRVLASLIILALLFAGGGITALAEGILVLPSNIRIINEKAFYGASFIDRIILSDQVTEIRSLAFAGSTLTEINLPDSLVFIAEDAFDCLERVTVTANPGTYAYDWAVAHQYIDENAALTLHSKKAKPGTAEYVDAVINEMIWTDRIWNMNLAAGKSAVFMFEGAGKYQGTDARQNALCIVVQLNDANQPVIVFEDDFCSTIPDRPKDPSSNQSTDVPTVIDGVYNLVTINHRGKYASVNIQRASVIRFCGTSPDGYRDVANGINIHRRSTNDNTRSGDDWANSSGCFLIGDVDHFVSDAYNLFISTVLHWDDVPLGDPPLLPSTGSDVGVVIVDRKLAEEYLTSIYGKAGAYKIMNLR